jgi:hypothetical protein
MSSTAKQIKVTGLNRAGHLVFAAQEIPPSLRTDERGAKYLAARARVLTRFRERYPEGRVQYVSIVEYRVSNDTSYRKEALVLPLCTTVLVNGLLPGREPVWVSKATDYEPTDALLVETITSALAEFRDRFPRAAHVTVRTQVNKL